MQIFLRLYVLSANIIRDCADTPNVAACSVDLGQRYEDPTPTPCQLKLKAKRPVGPEHVGQRLVKYMSPRVIHWLNMTKSTCSKNTRKTF